MQDRTKFSLQNAVSRRRFNYSDYCIRAGISRSPQRMIYTPTSAPTTAGDSESHTCKHVRAKTGMVRISVSYAHAIGQPGFPGSPKRHQKIKVRQRTVTGLILFMESESEAPTYGRGALRRKARRCMLECLHCPSF